uniref:Uncharacterized protein n=1 Tax=Solanum tuberosum TaxID=4113 RepID=M1DR82_SOLTU
MPPKNNSTISSPSSSSKASFYELSHLFLGARSLPGHQEAARNYGCDSGFRLRDSDLGRKSAIPRPLYTRNLFLPPSQAQSRCIKSIQNDPHLKPTKKEFTKRPLTRKPTPRLHDRAHEPWSRPRPVVLGKWLWVGVFASIMLRHDHEPSHEPWSRPLAVKWLVVHGPVAWPQGPSSHKAKAPSRGLPRALVKTTDCGGGREVGAVLAMLGQPWPLAFSLDFCSPQLNPRWSTKLREVILRF